MASVPKFSNLLMFSLWSDLSRLSSGILSNRPAAVKGFRSYSLVSLLFFFLDSVISPACCTLISCSRRSARLVRSFLFRVVHFLIGPLTFSGPNHRLYSFILRQATSNACFRFPNSDFWTPPQYFPGGCIGRSRRYRSLHHTLRFLRSCRVSSRFFSAEVRLFPILFSFLYV